MATAVYKRLTLKIDGYTPHTLPILRLIEYLRDLAALLGTESDAHFIEVGEGSAALAHDIPIAKYREVTSRIQAAERGEGSPELVRAYCQLRAKLRHDNTVAVFIADDGGTLIEFPSQEPEPTFGMVTQGGSLEGVLIKVGGRDETVPLHLQDATTYYKCSTTREIARQMAPYLFSAPLRVHGMGRWIRGEAGGWTLESFKVASWEKLNDDALEAVLARMRIAQSDWDKIGDPLLELKNLRNGNETTH